MQNRTYLPYWYIIVLFDHVKLTWLLRLFPAAPSRAASSCKSPPQRRATPLASSRTMTVKGRPSAPGPCSSACEGTRGLRLPQVLVFRDCIKEKRNDCEFLQKKLRRINSRCCRNFALLKIQVRRRGAAGEPAILVEINAVNLGNVCCFHFFQFLPPWRPLWVYRTAAGRPPRCGGRIWWRQPRTWIFRTNTIKKWKYSWKSCILASPLLLVLLEGGDVAGVGVGETCATDKIAEQNIKKTRVLQLPDRATVIFAWGSVFLTVRSIVFRSRL